MENAPDVLEVNALSVLIRMSTNAKNVNSPQFFIKPTVSPNVPEDTTKTLRITVVLNAKMDAKFAIKSDA
jgi:hypothetical protein